MICGEKRVILYELITFLYHKVNFIASKTYNKKKDDSCPYKTPVNQLLTTIMVKDIFSTHLTGIIS